ncbi:MAG: LON peptidase substrate-binding domain-containing protein [Acidimicrobiales bacterium]
MSELAMFPLGSVLFPGLPLTLHVFEPRYRALVGACVKAAERGEPAEFGVVLIERGAEVGGGDQRFTVGTVARLTQVAQLRDGRYATVAVGTRRVAVREWLADDPYPRAEVDDLDDAWFDPALDTPLRERAEAQVRRGLALKHQLGEPAYPADIELDDDPAAAAWQLAAIAPLGELDQLGLLRSPSCTDLLADLARLAEDEAAVLAFRLGSG